MQCAWDTACTGAQHAWGQHALRCIAPRSTARTGTQQGHSACSVHRDATHAEPQHAQGCSVQSSVVSTGMWHTRTELEHTPSLHTDTACTRMWAHSVCTFEPFRSFPQVQQEAWIIVHFAQVLVWQWEGVGL